MKATLAVSNKDTLAILRTNLGILSHITGVQGQLSSEQMQRKSKEKEETTNLPNEYWAKVNLGLDGSPSPFNYVFV